MAEETWMIYLLQSRLHPHLLLRQKCMQSPQGQQMTSMLEILAIFLQQDRLPQHHLLRLPCMETQGTVVGIARTTVGKECLWEMRYHLQSLLRNVLVFLSSQGRNLSTVGPAAEVQLLAGADLVLTIAGLVLALEMPSGLGRLCDTPMARKMHRCRMVAPCSKSNMHSLLRQAMVGMEFHLVTRCSVLHHLRCSTRRHTILEGLQTMLLSLQLQDLSTTMLLRKFLHEATTPGEEWHWERQYRRKKQHHELELLRPLTGQRSPVEVVDVEVRMQQAATAISPQVRSWNG